MRSTPGTPNKIRYPALLAAAFLLVALIFPTDVSRGQPETRPFVLGFTPFPYAISQEAVDFTYEHIAEDADLIVHHFDNGVPWVEALAGEPYSQNIRDDWSYRRQRTPPGHQVLVTVTPVNFMRDGLANYRGAQDDMPLPAPFDSYRFDDPDVATAFLRYCEDIIAHFEPDYFMFGIEVNLLMKLRPDLWDAYMTLHRQVYETLKAAHPDLPVFVSVTGIDLLEGYTDVDHADQMRALADILAYTDILGLSLYPYMTAYMTNSLPLDMFDRLAALTDKPIAVTETGYPAQSFGIDAGGGLRLEFNSDESKQADYIALLLDAAQAYRFVFVVNFVLRDYDALWQQIGGREDLTIAWRDTGLYDEDGHARPALDLWRAALTLPVNS
ncbi:MAG: hypothetical protein IT320_09765 [Anaerolineae bacterium]|nr:hypothetical protein [Anaerolineae bacterium]